METIGSEHQLTAPGVPWKARPTGTSIAVAPTKSNLSPCILSLCLRVSVVRSLQLPALVEEVRIDYLTRIAALGRRGGVDDGPVGQFRYLPGVVQVVVLPVGEAAVQHDITLGV